MKQGLVCGVLATSMVSAFAMGGCAASVVPGAGDMANVKPDDLAQSSHDMATNTDMPAVVPDFAGADFAQCIQTCSKAGQVTCNNNHSQTCKSVNGCLQLGPTMDCGSSGLCCATGCVPIDENNCGQCGGTCGGRTPACSSGAPYSCVCTGAACATVQEDCNTLTGMCQTCFPIPVPENRTDFWVDGAASVEPTCGQGCPYLTITQALAVAATSSATAPKTIHVAPGTYTNGGNNPETFPLMLRNGTSLVGSGQGATIVSGTGAYDHSALEGAFNGSAYQVTIVVGDATKSSTISGLSVVAGASHQTNGNYLGILCDEGNASSPYASPPPSPYPSATLVVDQVTVGPGFGDGLVCTNTATAAKINGCNLKMTRSTATGNGIGVWVIGGGQGSKPGGLPVAAQIGDLAGNGNKLTANTLSGGNIGYGLVIWDGSSPVHIYGNTFDGDDYGIAIGQHPLLDGTILVVDYLDMQNNILRNLNLGGLNLGAAAVIDQLIGNTFTNISNPNTGGAPAYAIQLSGDGGSTPVYRPEIRRARNNVFIANDIAFGTAGAGAIDGNDHATATDFGTVADPGHNMFVCNAVPSPGPSLGGDVYIPTTAINGGALSFVGNSWDHAPPNQSPTQTNGTDVVVVSGGPTITLTGATVAASPCPVTNRPL